MAVNYKSQVKEVSQADYIKIDVQNIHSGKFLPFDVYVKHGDTLKKLFNKGMIISKIHLDVLTEKGISYVYIDSSEQERLDTYIRKPTTQESVLDSPVLFQNYSFNKEQYFQIERNLLHPDSKINFSVYCLENFNLNKIIDASDESPKLISDFKIPLYGDLLIKSSDIQRYRDYLSSLEKNQAENSETRYLILKESAKVHMRELLSEPRSGEKIKKISDVVENLIVTLNENPDSIYDLLTLRGHDYYTYTHCINVGALAVGLGLQAGLDKETVYHLGVGAILHDIGKAEIPHEILNKQGKLTDYEYRVIQTHVRLGYEILKQHKFISPKSLDAELHHHEKLSGRGYPLGLKGKEISLFGRITEIADCYDALTTRRPYKPPYTPFFALSIIVKEKGDHDPDLLKAFIKMLGKIK